MKRESLFCQHFLHFMPPSTLVENHPKCLIWIFQNFSNGRNIVWKLLKMSYVFHFWHFPPIFVCLVTLFAWTIQVFKSSQNGLFWHFSWIFVHFWKCSSLRPQCWMRLFLRFSNTVGHYPNWLECLSCLSMLSNQDNFSSFSGLSDL